MTDLRYLHPTSDLLEQYAMKRLQECQISDVEEHMLICDICCGALTAIEEEIKMIRLVLGGANALPSAAPSAGH